MAKYSAAAVVCLPPLGSLLRVVAASPLVSSTAHNLHTTHNGDKQDPFSSVDTWLTIVTIIVLVLLGGLFAGLTLGLLSLDLTALEVLEQSGQPNEKEHARKIRPIRKKGHWLLVTLLLSNVIVNETLPILTDSLWGGGWPAVVISTTLIVIFGEIIPQSVCARYGLTIGAKMVWPVKILMWFMCPIAYPISKILDWALGETEGMSYKRSELKALVGLHVKSGEHPGPLNVDEVTIIKAVLDLRDKSVSQVMTPLEDVYMVNWDQILDHPLITELMQRGHSRIPVYAGIDRRNIVGMLLVKKLISCDSAERQPIKSFTHAITSVPVIDPLMPCFDILNLFQEGRSHMAVVVDDTKSNQGRNNGFTSPIQSKIKSRSVDSHHHRQQRSHSPPSGNNSIFQSPSSVASAHLANKELISDPYNRPIPNTIGIVTLEDVIEELIGEEIIDETDEYVDVHEKLPVNRRLQRTPKMAPNTPHLGPNIALTTSPAFGIPLPRTRSNFTINQTLAASRTCALASNNNFNSNECTPYDSMSSISGQNAAVGDSNTSLTGRLPLRHSTGLGKSTQATRQQLSPDNDGGTSSRQSYRSTSRRAKRNQDRPSDIKEGDGENSEHKLLLPK